MSPCRVLRPLVAAAVVVAAAGAARGAAAVVVVVVAVLVCRLCGVVEAVSLGLRERDVLSVARVGEGTDTDEAGDGDAVSCLSSCIWDAGVSGPPGFKSKLLLELLDCMYGFKKDSIM